MLAFHAIKLLVQDVKDLVSKHVKTSIKLGLMDPDDKIHSLALKRKKNLTEWEKDDYPLTWNMPNSNRGCYCLLLVILNEDASRDFLPGLQHSSDNLTYIELASSLVHFATSGRSQVTPPMTLNGYFTHALPLAIHAMEKFKPENRNFVDFATEIMASMLMKLEIHFLPWNRDAMGTGPKPRTVLANWWMIIDRRMPSVSGQSRQPVAETSHSVALNIASENPSAPWTIPGKLREMGSLWKKTSLPTDWDLKHASIAHAQSREDYKYIAETYEHVKSIYDGSNWRHHMGLVWGILFSRVVPMVSHTRLESYPSISDPKAITKWVRGIPWTKTTRTRGNTAPEPYLVMVSTTIIALRDVNSPLSIWAQKKNNALGKPWTDKHGMRLVY